MTTPPDDRDWDEKSQRQSNAVLVERLEYLRGDLRRIETKIDSFETKIIQVEQNIASRYITQDEFTPVKIIAYGFVALVCVGFVGLLMHTVGWRP